MTSEDVSSSRGGYFLIIFISQVCHCNEAYGNYGRTHISKECISLLVSLHVSEPQLEEEEGRHWLLERRQRSKTR